MTKIFKPERIPISKLDGVSEKSIQDMIAADPSIIGLGDLVLKDKERIQPRAGVYIGDYGPSLSFEYGPPVSVITGQQL